MLFARCSNSGPSENGEARLAKLGSTRVGYGREGRQPKFNQNNIRIILSSPPISEEALFPYLHALSKSEAVMLCSMVGHTKASSTWSRTQGIHRHSLSLIIFPASCQRAGPAMPALRLLIVLTDGIESPLKIPLPSALMTPNEDVAEMKKRMA